MDAIRATVCEARTSSNKLELGYQHGKAVANGEEGGNLNWVPVCS